MKIHTAELEISAHRRDQFRRDGLSEVAFVGRSNVGKSSLMNRLLGRKKLARTSSTPGRTQAINYFLVNQRFYFVDLPGYGFAKASRGDRERWAALMDDYFRGATDRRVLLLQLIDAKVGATPLDAQGFEYFESLSLDPVLVATKIDKVPRSRRVRQLRGIGQTLDLEETSSVSPVSATTGDGIRELWKDILVFLDGEETTTSG